MKTIVTETSLETNFWSAAIRTAAYFLENSFTININEQICEPCEVTSVEDSKPETYLPTERQ